MSEEMGDFAEIWQAADKDVYSTTLTDVRTRRTRIERRFARCPTACGSSSNCSTSGGSQGAWSTSTIEPGTPRAIRGSHHRRSTTISKATVGCVNVH
jgi:hypothetical protein